jgi:peptidoglycan/LPS O-acetylase OafA/YrhL
LISYGWVGVPMFFVISGYCIAAACESVGFSRASWKTFFLRRFKRIYPPYWIALLLLLVLHLLLAILDQRAFLLGRPAPFANPSALSVWQWLGTLTLTETWRDHLFGNETQLLLNPAWSLCYEEQFYAVCGLLLVFSRQHFYKALLGVSLGVVALAVVNYGVRPIQVNGFFFDGRWIMFASGVGVFYSLKLGSAKSRKATLIALTVALGLSASWWVFQRVSLPREFAFAFAFSIALLILHRHDNYMDSLILLSPIKFCGQMCYSLYLIHWPVSKFICHTLYEGGVRGEYATLAVTIPISVIASIFIAWLFHVFVERKFMNIPLRLTASVAVDTNGHANTGAPIPISIATAQIMADTTNVRSD